MSPITTHYPITYLPHCGRYLIWNILEDVKLQMRLIFQGVVNLNKQDVSFGVEGLGVLLELQNRNSILYPPMAPNMYILRHMQQ